MSIGGVYQSGGRDRCFSVIIVAEVASVVGTEAAAAHMMVGKDGSALLLAMFLLEGPPGFLDSLPGSLAVAVIMAGNRTVAVGSKELTADG
jgi:hypothetical protein